MQFPISIELHRSRLLATFLVAIHAGAAACVLVLPWNWPSQAALIAAIAVSLARAWRRPNITALRLVGKDAIEGVFADGERAALTLLPETTVFRWLVVLRLRTAGEGGTASLSVLPDQLPTNDFRVLRLWLRWRADAERGTVRRVS